MRPGCEEDEFSIGAVTVTLRRSYRGEEGQGGREPAWRGKRRPKGETMRKQMDGNKE